MMKRPQSAKPGYRAPMAQSSADEIKESDVSYKNLHRKQVKLLKSDLTTSNFARIMPKKIYQDKERLYSQGLQLKQKLNELQQENIRLKTRISILEKQRGKLTKVIDCAAESGHKSQSKFKVYQGPVSDKQSAILLNLKKIVREYKEQNDYLRQQNVNIKKVVKFTKINQSQIQCKILKEQYQKLQNLLADMSEDLQIRDENQREAEQLNKSLDKEKDKNKELLESNKKYLLYIEELQEKLKTETEKAMDKEKKWQREMALQKRKLNEQIKVSDQLRRQVKLLRETPQKLEMKKKTVPTKHFPRPLTSFPLVKHENQNESKLSNKETEKKLQIITKQNQKLGKLLQETKEKLEKTQKENITIKQQEQEKKKQPTPQKFQEYKERKVTADPQQEYDDENFEDFQKSSHKNSPNKIQNSKNVVKKDDNEVYDDKFDDFEQDDKSLNKKINQTPTKAIDSNVEMYNKDLGQADGDEEELYKKQVIKKQKKKSKSNKKIAANEKAKAKNESSINGFQPNKEILSQMKQLLTYRMKAQRYPYNELQKDILLSNETNFICADVETMLKAEPFYLNSLYSKAFLEYLFEKKVIQPEQSVTTEALLKKIRKVVKDFSLPDEQEEEERLMSIAQMTSQYPEELDNAFEKIKNGPETVSKRDLTNMFKKLELADYFIEIIISELSLCSEDLNHLSIRGFFERFYLEGMQNADNAIDQEPLESSGEQKTKSKNKIPKIDQEEEYDDEKANFIMQGKSKKLVDSI